MAQGPARIASGSSAWVDITGKPSTFPPSAHNQAWSTITSTPTTLTGYGITDAQPLDSDLTSIAALATTTFGRSLLTQADAAAARTTIGAGTSSFNGAYASLTGIPSTFTPAAHNQAWSTITGTPTTLSGYGITAALGDITPSSVAATGAVTGSNLSGTNTGDQTSVTGNAGTATKLATARTINGVSFDGSANITVPAAAGTLTGSTLASGVTASSLTSAAGGTFGTAAFTAATAYDPAGAAAAITLAGLGGVPTSRTVNGHALTGNVSVTPSDLSLAIGTNTQAWSAKLDAISALAAGTGWLHNDGAGVLAWSAPSKSDVGLGSVENTALSTWTGSAKLATVGTITAGTWHGTALADTYIASAAAWNAKVSFPGFGTTAETAARGNDARLSDARTPLAHNQAWSTITSTPTTLSGYGITDAQRLDSDLSALAGLSTTGLVARTGAGTAATRTITGTTNQVIVSNGDGVAGNPSLSLPQSIAASSSVQFAGLGVGVTAPGSGASVGVATATQAAALNLAVTGGSSIGEGAAISFLHSGTERTYRIYGSAVGSNTGSLVFARGTAAGYTDAVIFSYDGKLRFAAYGAGTLVTDSSGNVTASSDASLKTVTGSFTRGLADVLKLTPRTYHWNEKSGMNTEDENVGFIAQEVLESIPEAVGQYRTSEVEVDGKKTKKREKAELLTLSDRPIIAALVNAVKELKAENDDLRARVSALEKGKASK